MSILDDYRSRKLQIFSLLLPITMLVMTLSGAGKNLIRYYESADWERVDAAVTHTNLKITSDSDGADKYLAEATYTYEWRGKKYHSSNVTQQTDDSSSSKEESERMHKILTNHLEKNTPIRIYVNPKQPNQAAAFRDPNWSGIFLLSFLLLIPLTILYVTLLDEQRDNLETTLNTQLKNQHPTEPWKWREIWQDNIVFCSNEIDNKGSYIITLIVSLIVGTCLLLGFMSNIWLGVLMAVFMSPLIIISINSLYRRVRENRILEEGGETKFLLNEIPVFTGEKLSGTLWGLSALRRNTILKISIRCITKEYIGDSSWDARTHWKYAKRTHLKRSHLNHGLQIETEIPQELPAIDWHDKNKRTIWLLSVKAENKDIGFNREFELPIFNKAKL